MFNLPEVTPGLLLVLEIITSLHLTLRSVVMNKVSYGLPSLNQHNRNEIYVLSGNGVLEYRSSGYFTSFYLLDTRRPVHSVIANIKHYNAICSNLILQLQL